VSRKATARPTEDDDNDDGGMQRKEKKGGTKGSPKRMMISPAYIFEVEV
jgi:hypothetical protein